MSEWRKIETAPKDGKPILVAWGSGFVPETASWDVGTRRWVTQWIPLDLPSGYIPIPCETPTHWMPIPAPPSDGGSR